MLDIFRENARGWIIQVVIGAVAFVFIFSWGKSGQGWESLGGKKSLWAAKVNGEEIPRSVFDRAVENRFKMMQRFRQNYSLDDARSDNLKANVMKELVGNELVTQAARAHGLAIGDDELFESISKREEFKKGGQFDAKTYTKVVNNYFGLSPQKFEERVRREMLAQRMLELAQTAVTVSDDEIQAEFLKNEESASIEYVRFVASQFADRGEATDAEIDAILKDRKADAEKKFEENRFRYVVPKGKKARRIFFAVKPDATPDEEAAAKAKSEEAKKALDGGLKFDDALAKFSTDPASADLGWVELGRSGLGKTLEEETFKLKAGETSAVVRDRLGFSIINVSEERQASEKKFDEVAREIAKELAKETKAKGLASAEAAAALEKLKAGTPLATMFPRDEVKEGEDPGKPSDGLAKKPQALPTESFHPFGGTIPGIGEAPALTQLVFSMGADKRIPDAPVQVGDAYFVFELKTRTRADLAKLDAAEKDRTRERLKSQKMGDLRKAWEDDLRKNADVKENTDALSYATGDGVQNM